MRVQKICRYGLYLALMIIMGYVEMLIPFVAIAPFFKIGIANIIVLVILHRDGFLPAITINICRIIIINLLFGNTMTLVLSLSGGIFATVLMFLASKLPGVTSIGISALGGTAHNIAQIFAAVLLTQTTGLLRLLPILMLTGLFTGIICGLAAIILNKNLDKIKFFK